jgi:hypothetical protein
MTLMDQRMAKAAAKVGMVETDTQGVDRIMAVLEANVILTTEDNRK